MVSSNKDKLTGEKGLVYVLTGLIKESGNVSNGMGQSKESEETKEMGGLGTKMQQRRTVTKQGTSHGRPGIGRQQSKRPYTDGLGAGQEAGIKTAQLEAIDRTVMMAGLTPDRALVN